MKKSISTQPCSPQAPLYPDALRCVKCGACRAVCPSFLRSRQESLSPRGRVALIKAVAEGELAASVIYEDRLETCTTCLACEEVCASKVPVTALIQAAKEQAVAELGPGLVKRVLAGVLRNEQAMRATSWLAPLLLHYKPGAAGNSAPRIRDARQSPGEQSGIRGTAVFFPGCSIGYFQPELRKSAISVLNGIGYQVIVPEGIKCCGRPLLSLGDRQAAQELAAHNAGVLSGISADVIVTACASCSLTFKKEYPTLVAAGRGPAVLDIHEFLHSQRQHLKLGRISRSITWHDPCHLGRGQGLAQTARDLLLGVPAVKLVEMKNPDRCCGFGGVMRITHRDVSDAIAAEKIKSIIETRADAVVTGCPSCRMQLQDALARAGSRIKVLHTLQLLEQAME